MIDKFCENPVSAVWRSRILFSTRQKWRAISNKKKMLQEVYNF